MRVFWLNIGVALIASGACCAWAEQTKTAQQLVRDVVNNELHDHDTHGYWRYWIEKHSPNATRLEEQVETADGPIARLVAANGRLLDAEGRRAEQARLENLANSPLERAGHRRAYAEDEKRITAVFQMLSSDAFFYAFAGEENNCYHLLFRPNPNFATHTLRARVFHAMSGDLWIDARTTRLVRLEGKLDNDIEIGFGLLGRIDRGGWFRLQRVQVSPTEWKTANLEVHLSGRAMLFDTINRDTSETRGGFASVPAGLNLEQGMHIVEQANPDILPGMLARVSPASLPARR